MKKICNYTFQLVCIYIYVLTLFSIFNFDITKTNYGQYQEVIVEPYTQKESIYEVAVLVKK